MSALFEAHDLSRCYPGVLANDAISLTIERGRIHALLGENGSGKSTLVKMMYGLLQPDSGRMSLNGHPYRPVSPRAARAAGIAMVFQHFSLFEAMSVTENISLGMETPPPPSLLARRIGDIGETYGLPIKPSRLVGDLSAGQRQRVEIMRCLVQEPSLLIMDEPTSVLTQREADSLFETLRLLAKCGTGILYISHRMEEIRSLCDTATILRQGRVIGHCDPRLTSAADMAASMIGSRTREPMRSTARAATRPLLEVERISMSRRSQFSTALHDISFTVHAGEVFGIAGIAGNGQDELYAALSGEGVASGTVRLDGIDMTGLGPARRRSLGFLAAPEERLGHAAVPTMSLAHNALLTASTRKSLLWHGLVDWAATRRFADEIMTRFDVRAENAKMRADALSGGNLQKFVIGREILQQPKLLLVHQPTWGVDVAAAATIRQALLDLAADGRAVIVISQDLDELLSLCDRLSVITRGRLGDAVAPAAVSAATIGLMMDGISVPHDQGDHGPA